MVYTKDTLKKIYRSLPDEIRQVVATQETSAINDEIAKVHGLKSEQRLALGDEVTMRLMGVTTSEKFLSNLETRLETTAESAQKIAEDVRGKILSKIPEKILVAQEKHAQTKLKEVPAVTQVAALEIAPEIHPMVEPASTREASSTRSGEGKVAHNVPLPENRGEVPQAEERVAPPVVEQNTNLSENKPEQAPGPPKVAYPHGQDPYREPAE